MGRIALPTLPKITTPTASTIATIATGAAGRATTTTATTTTAPRPTVSTGTAGRSTTTTVTAQPTPKVTNNIGTVIKPALPTKPKVTLMPATPKVTPSPKPATAAIGNLAGGKQSTTAAASTPAAGNKGAVRDLFPKATPAALRPVASKTAAIKSALAQATPEQAKALRIAEDNLNNTEVSKDIRPLPLPEFFDADHRFDYEFMLDTYAYITSPQNMVRIKDVLMQKTQDKSTVDLVLSVFNSLAQQVVLQKRLLK